MMPQPLAGKRIAVAGGRRFEDLSQIIAKQGGLALSRPMMGSVSNDSGELCEMLHALCKQGADWFVLVTGVGTRALLEKADELGLGQRLRDILAQARIAARGYKTLNVLKSLNIKPIIIDDDGTVEGLRRQLAAFDVAHQHVAMQLHGERMPALTDWLLSQGAKVTEIPLYFYEAPPEPDLRQLIFEVIAADIDALAFTSNTQVKFLFEGARRLGAETFLQRALNEKVIALSVGSVTTAELHKHGVTRIVAPEHERMGAMVMALVAHYREHTDVDKQGESARVGASEKATYFPVVLTKLNKVVVIGGGNVATRKVKALLGAEVTPIVVSPDLSAELLELKTQGNILHLEKCYETSDVQNAQLVIAATSNEAVNEYIARDARIHKLLCNVVDKSELGNVHTVGTIRRGNVLVTVSSQGTNPSLTRHLKEELENYIPQRYAEVAQKLATQREALQGYTAQQRQQIIQQLLEKQISNISKE